MSRPVFSVIITTHNRPKLVVQCVESVLAQNFARHEFEIIVVDDGSRSATAKALAPFHQAGYILYLRQSQQGWGVARLNGVHHSRGDFLIFLDDDCLAPPLWLATYAEMYKKYPQAAGVGGGLRHGTKMNVAGWKQYHGHRAYFERLNAPMNITHTQAGRVWFTFGGNRSFRKSAWMAVQTEGANWYFDDYAIDLRLREREAFIYYEPAAWVEHYYFLNLAQRLRSAYRYGRSEKSLTPSVNESSPATPQSRLGLRGRWKRMKSEAPEASPLELIWYAMTQPLVWAARRLGHRQDE